MNYRSVFLIHTPLLFCLFSESLSTLHVEGPAESVSKQRGVSWVAGRKVAQEHFTALLENNVNWITQTPFGWQQSYNTPALQMATSGRILWGETDIGLETTTRLAKKLGIKTLLKPHIWLRGRQDDKWRSDIAMESETDWQSWFADYRKFILHYARLAEKNGIEALSIGTELHATVKQKPDEWQKLIAEIRKVYTGKLTYSANWYDEFEDVTFWDKLDFIGIQGYFPLTDKESPTIPDLLAGWQQHLEAIERLQAKYQKPVLFTEIGYRSTTDSAIKPWEWMRSHSEPTQPELETQANCYEAFFQTFWHKSWFAGAFFWKWFPDPDRNSRRGRDRFSLQGNPAEKVMARWYAETGN